MTLEVRATGYEVKRPSCQLAGFAGVANRSVTGEAFINAQRQEFELAYLHHANIETPCVVTSESSDHLNDFDPGPTPRGATRIAERWMPGSSFSQWR